MIAPRPILPSTRSFARLSLGALVCALVALPMLASAERAPWDQARATAAAADLAAATDKLYDGFYKLPPPPVAQQGKYYYSIKQKLRVLKNESRHLAAALKEGEGLEATESTYANIQQLRRSVRDDARMAGFVPEDVLALADQARDAGLRLAPYYDEDWQAAAPAAK